MNRNNAMEEGNMGHMVAMTGVMLALGGGGLALCAVRVVVTVLGHLAARRFALRVVRGAAWFRA